MLFQIHRLSRKSGWSLQMWQSLQTSVNAGHGTTGISDVCITLLSIIFIHVRAQFHSPFLTVRLYKTLRNAGKKSQMDAIQDGARYLEMASTVNSSNAIAISQKHYTEFARPQDLPSQVCVSELFMTCLQLCIIWFLCSNKSYNCQVARDN